MTNFLKRVTIIFFSVLLIACGANKTVEQSRNTKDDGSLQQIKEITVDKLSKNSLDQYLIIDVRELSELQAGVIPNSVHIPMGTLNTKLSEYLQAQSKTDGITNIKDTPILLYCGSGRRSYNSAETLKQLGFTNLTSLDGGFNDYKKKQNGFSN